MKGEMTMLFKRKQHSDSQPTQPVDVEQYLKTQTRYSHYRWWIISGGSIAISVIIWVSIGLFKKTIPALQHCWESIAAIATRVSQISG